MGNIWSILLLKQTPLRSLNWIYPLFGPAWNFLKSLLIANLDEQPPPLTPNTTRNARGDPRSERRKESMASVVAQDTAELRLTLPVERASSSPFPSPGSSFYPPPRLGAHEFALRPPFSKTRDPASQDKDTMPHRDGAVTPTGTLSPPPPLSVSMSAVSPTTPTPGSVFQIKTPTAQITMPDPPLVPDTPISLSAAAVAALSNTSNRDSLTSSRPAPPSPAVSRRASAALSRHSSTARSRRQSKASSFSSFSPLPLPLHEPEPSTSSSATAVLPTPSPSPSPQQQQPKPRILFFKIRDFGGEEDEGEGEAPGDWGRYQWNTLSSRFSWGSAEDGAQQDGSRPSHSDLEKNFNVSSPVDADEYDDEDGQDDALIPGLYRALYTFEPEGTAEMALEEEQIVHVVGRGGGVGWAVVEREEGGHALVPESYLELMEAD
ncbi:hypothetical protein GSI_00091 [Ganoderma sinense ZZ0214-1]|uniref:SH3 domain-containing protein n=1 Tax=Ganoderma sinense ZZ0214-1 TaxID=1077348 RepID=A0A2G8SRR1_9APHY|nr:hypothetical protein GSI_00091 [Ganoderma sinense ZZ0214-1]